MNIAIVDDCAQDSCHLSQLLGAYCSACSLALQVSTFTRAADFLRSWKSGVFDLIFIDIFLDKDSDTASGIRLAEHIRREDTGLYHYLYHNKPGLCIKKLFFKGTGLSGKAHFHSGFFSDHGLLPFHEGEALFPLY